VLPVDSKAGVLVDELRKLAADAYEQALVFTQYTDALDFLRDELVRSGLRVICLFWERRRASVVALAVTGRG
jgi:hypothetical protein